MYVKHPISPDLSIAVIGYTWMMSAFFELFETVFCSLRLEYCEFRQNWKNSTSYKKWKTTWKVAKLASNLTGIHVLDDCEWRRLTTISVLLILETLIVPFYSVWSNWQENKLTAIQPFVSLALVVPVNVLNLQYKIDTQGIWTHLYPVKIGYVRLRERSWAMPISSKKYILVRGKLHIQRSTTANGIRPQIVRACGKVVFTGNSDSSNDLVLIFTYHDWADLRSHCTWWIFDPDGNDCTIYWAEHFTGIHDQYDNTNGDVLFRLSYHYGNRNAVLLDQQHDRSHGRHSVFQYAETERWALPGHIFTWK